jgi:ribonucleotide reductase alpha subunit
LLDNVVDLTQFPLESVDQMLRRNRRIGLGNSMEGRTAAAEAIRSIRENAFEASVSLGIEKRGFPHF